MHVLFSGTKYYTIINVCDKLCELVQSTSMDDYINSLIVELVDVQNKGWTEVYALVMEDYPELTQAAIRGRYYRHKDRDSTGPEIVGFLAGDAVRYDTDDAIERAKNEWKKAQGIKHKKENQIVSFSDAPVCLVAMADVHAGGHGVDYERLFSEAEIISKTPGMYVILAGDLLDQFIIGSLRNIKFHTRFSQSDEWAIVYGLLELISHKIIVSVAGNHDNWSSYLIGVDYFATVMASVNKNILYDQHDCLFTLIVNGYEWKIRVRHKWRGTSMYNDTHGIEKAAKWDQDFDIGIGAHTHASGLARPFNRAGEDAWAILCGSYKREDDFARRHGFPRPNNATAVPLAFSKGGTVISFQTIADARDYMLKFVDG
jgi:hypothetical protein